MMYGKSKRGRRMMNKGGDMDAKNRKVGTGGPDNSNKRIAKPRMGLGAGSKSSMGMGTGSRAQMVRTKRSYPMNTRY